MPKHADFENDEHSGPLLGERLAIEINKATKYADTLEWVDWLGLITRFCVDRDTAKRLRQIVLAGQTGRLALVSSGDGSGSPFKPWCTELESVVDRGDPPTAVDGLDGRPRALVTYLLDQLLDQYNLAILTEKDPMSRVAMRQSGEEQDTVAYKILRWGVLLDELKPGGGMVITGNPDSGKTFFAVQDVMAPALVRGYNVVSNVDIDPRPEEFKGRLAYAPNLSEYLLSIFDAAALSRRTLAIRDEGALGRAKQKAQSQRNMDLKMLTMIFRKFGVVEVTVYQIPGDVPSELREFCTHRINKPEQGLAYVVTPIVGLNKRIISGIPGLEERQAEKLLTLPYNSLEIPPLAHDVNVLHLIDRLALIERDPKTGEKRSRKDQLAAMRDYIIILRGDKEAEGWNEEQLIHCVTVLHRNVNHWGFRKIATAVDTELTRLGLSHKWVYDTVFRNLHMRGHENRKEKWCEWCLTHRTTEFEGTRTGRVRGEVEADSDKEGPA